MRRDNKFAIFIKQRQKQRSEYRRGSHGAASEVRHIDAAEYQPRAVAAPTNRLPQHQTKTLLDAADKLLVADAKKRHGKRYAERVRNSIVTGHYR
jgi:hypothetical protein